MCTLHESKCTSELLKFHLLLEEASVCEQMTVFERQLDIDEVRSLPTLPFSSRNNLPLQCCPVFFLHFIPSTLHVHVIQNTALASWCPFFFSLYIFFNYYFYFIYIFSVLGQYFCIVPASVPTHCNRY